MAVQNTDIATLCTVTTNGSQNVVISCLSLEDKLKQWYEADHRLVEVVVEVDGRKLNILCSILAKRRRGGKERYLLYPLSAAQKVLFEMYRRHRGAAPRGIKTPLPILVYDVRLKRYCQGAPDCTSTNMVASEVGIKVRKNGVFLYFPLSYIRERFGKIPDMIRLICGGKEVEAKLYMMYRDAVQYRVYSRYTPAVLNSDECVVNT
jgi:hypothetical protein